MANRPGTIAPAGALRQSPVGDAIAPDPTTMATVNGAIASSITELVERAGIEYMSYDTEVREAEDTEQASIEAAQEYDAVCVDATRSGAISQAVFGSPPEKTGTELTPIVIAGSEKESTMSIREAIMRRLET